MWSIPAALALILAVAALIGAQRACAQARKGTEGFVYWREPPDMSPAAAAALITDVVPGVQGAVGDRQMTSTLLSLATKGAVAVYPGSAAGYRGIDLSRADCVSVGERAARRAAARIRAGGPAGVRLQPDAGRLKDWRQGYAWLRGFEDACNAEYQALRATVPVGAGARRAWHAGHGRLGAHRAHLHGCIRADCARACHLAAAVVRFRVRDVGEPEASAHSAGRGLCRPSGRFDAVHGGFQRIRRPRRVRHRAVGSVHGLCGGLWHQRQAHGADGARLPAACRPAVGRRARIQRWPRVLVRAPQPRHALARQRHPLRVWMCCGRWVVRIDGLQQLLVGGRGGAR